MYWECQRNETSFRVHIKAGESIIIGVAGAGQEIKTRPFQLVQEKLERYSFGGARGRTDVPKIGISIFKEKLILIQ